MATNTVETPKSPEETFAAAKAAFEEVKRRTTGDAKPGPKPKAAPAEAPKAEEPKKEAAEAPAEKPKPKAKPQPKPAAADHTAALSAQIKSLEEKLTALTAPKPEPEEDPLEEIRADLVERFGEDEAGSLIRALESLHAPAAKRIAQLEQIIQDARTQGQKQISKSNRKRLASDYPHLKESDEAWEMLTALVTTSFGKDAKKYDSVDEAYDDIAAKLFGSLKQQEDVEADPEPEEDPTEEDEEIASRIAASSMTAPAKSGNKERRSRIDKQREHFEYMKKHPTDKAGALRLARELGIDR